MQLSKDAGTIWESLQWLVTAQHALASTTGSTSHCHLQPFKTTWSLDFFENKQQFQLVCTKSKAESDCHRTSGEKPSLISPISILANLCAHACVTMICWRIGLYWSNKYCIKSHLHMYCRKIYICMSKIYPNLLNCNVRYHWALFIWRIGQIQTQISRVT